MKETNQMMLEDENSYRQETKVKVTQKEIKIEQLKSRNKKLTLENKVYETELTMTEMKIVAKLEEQKSRLQVMHEELMQEQKVKMEE